MKITKDKQISMCLFFTYESSLKGWSESGILDREVSLYKKLVEQGVKIAFFTYGNEDDYEYRKLFPGIEIIPVYVSVKKLKNRKLAFFQSLLFPIKFRKVLKKYKIFKTNQMWGAWVPLIAKWLCKRKLLVRCGFEHYYTLIAEGSKVFTRLWFYWLSRLVYSSAEHIILTAEYISKFVEKTFHIPINKISVYSNFVDTELFFPKESEKVFDKRILFIGRLSREKNLFALIKACKNIDIGLDLAGEGSLRIELNTFAKQINADATFLGILSNNDIPSLIAKYPIFILPSFYEGNPKAMLEAMSCAKAVIGSDVGGIREIINDGENGILCGAKASEISSSIKKLISNRQLRLKMGKNAREYVIKNASIGEIVKKEIEIYKKILKI